jgi:hypothetical protein
MRVTIRNLAGHLLICTLNSGRTIHLAPAEMSEPLNPLELSGNEKIDELVRSRLVSIEPSEPAESTASQIQVENEIEVAHEAGEPPLTVTEFESDGTAPQTTTPTPSVGTPLTKASFSRFQLLIFTFVIGGLFLILSIKAGKLVDVPANVLVLLGISTGSYLVSKAVT